MLHSRMLAYLDEVVRAGSIRRAAERLGIAASSINRQIIALEQEYGVALFERLPRRLRRTAAGEVLIAHVRSTLREQAAMRSRLTDLEGKRRGIMRLATINGLVPSVLPLVGWMRQHHPLVKLVVHAMPLDVVVNAVVAGESDLGLGYQLPPDPKLRVLARVPSRVGAIMAPDHARAGLRDISLADCLGFPMIIPDATISIGALLADAFERAAITVDTVVETNSIELMRRAVMAGDTISFLSEFEADVDRRQGTLAFIPLRGPQAPAQELNLVCRRAGSLDAMQSKIAAELREMLTRC